MDRRRPAAAPMLQLLEQCACTLHTVRWRICATRRCACQEEAIGWPEATLPPRFFPYACLRTLPQAACDDVRCLRRRQESHERYRSLHHRGGPGKELHRANLVWL